MKTPVDAESEKLYPVFIPPPASALRKTHNNEISTKCDPAGQNTGECGKYVM